MADSAPSYGTFGWFDLTVDDAESIRDFYMDVAGWTSSPLSMGDYDDYVMTAADGTPVAGVCHARGANAGLPAQWLLYVNVPDIEDSFRSCEQRGGKVLSAIRKMPGHGLFCVVQDPAGASLALFQPDIS